MNLFDYQTPRRGERFDTLLETRNVRIVRIVSSDNIEPILYVQDDDEWVVVLEGEATLEVNGKEALLRKGDYLFIPASTPHRVIATAKGTLWLAVHIS